MRNVYQRYSDIIHGKVLSCQPGEVLRQSINSLFLLRFLSGLMRRSIPSDARPVCKRKASRGPGLVQGSPSRSAEYWEWRAGQSEPSPHSRSASGTGPRRPYPRHTPCRRHGRRLPGPPPQSHAPVQLPGAAHPVRRLSDGQPPASPGQAWLMLPAPPRQTPTRPCHTCPSSLCTVGPCHCRQAGGDPPNARRNGAHTRSKCRSLSALIPRLAASYSTPSRLRASHSAASMPSQSCSTSALC